MKQLNIVLRDKIVSTGGRADRQKDGQTDGHGDFNVPHKLSLRGYNKSLGNCQRSLGLKLTLQNEAYNANMRFP